MTNGPPSQRDRRSLQDLAKLASSPSLGGKTPAPPPVSVSKPEVDSGIVDLKVIAKADEGAEQRAQRTQLASTPLFDDDGGVPADAEPAPAVPSSPSSGPASSPKVSPSGARLASTPPAPVTPAQPAPKGALTWVLAGLGIAAVAVAGLMVVRMATKSPQPPPAVTPPPVATAPAAESPTPSAASPAPPAASGAVAESPAPGAETAPGASPTPIGLRKTAPGGVKAGPGNATSPSNPPGTTSLAETLAKAGAGKAAGGLPGDLNQAVEHAAGPGPGGAAVAAQPSGPGGPQFAPGSVPEKPSQGAVTGALGRALPEARACLNSDDQPAKANITFEAAGSVSSVVVSGTSAGATAEACIKKALSKATVPPFAQSTYSANVTVRPN